MGQITATRNLVAIKVVRHAGQSLTYRTQDLVKIDSESFELEHIFKCDRNILVLAH